MNTALINKLIGQLEDLTGECFQDSHPQLDELYSKFLDGEIKYYFLANLITKEIDELNR